MEKYRNQLIIFSKNRACQLRLLLDSLRANSPTLFDRISILFKADDEFYSKGYEQLKQYYPALKYVQETNFRNNLIGLIDDEIEATTFMVDDAVVFRPIMARKIDIIRPVVKEYAIFSLRLGMNCNYSHPADLHYTLGEHEVNGEYLKFDYTKQMPGDFRYPLSTDGHIFNTTLIKDMLINTEFNNPNSLEANLQKFVVMNSIPKTVISFTESKLVSIPANLVNNSFKNRHGLLYFYSEKELNDKYLTGETIDLTAMSFEDINGPHKEIKYEFKTN